MGLPAGAAVHGDMAVGVADDDVGLGEDHAPHLLAALGHDQQLVATGRVPDADLERGRREAIVARRDDLHAHPLAVGPQHVAGRARGAVIEADVLLEAAVGRGLGDQQPVAGPRRGDDLPRVDGPVEPRQVLPPAVRRARDGAASSTSPS